MKNNNYINIKLNIFIISYFYNLNMLHIFVISMLIDEFYQDNLKLCLTHLNSDKPL